MGRELLFFTKENFIAFRMQKKEEGVEIISITDYLQNFDKISEIDDDTQIVDITSIASINELQYNAERVFPLFNQNTLFIADKKTEEILSYNLRYCFEEFRDLVVPTHIDSPISIEKIMLKTAPNHKKIVDLDSSQLKDFLLSFFNHIIIVSKACFFVKRQGVFCV